jgi:hypothetical protein
VRLWLNVIAYKLGNPLAPVSAAQEDWELVVEEFAAALGENRRTAGRACALLLAVAVRRASHAAAFRQHVAKGRGAAAAERVANRDRELSLEESSRGE